MSVLVAEEVVDGVHQGNGHVVGLYWSAGWVADFPVAGFEVAQFVFKQLVVWCVDQASSESGLERFAYPVIGPSAVR
ncbi:MAG: hypothetical protein H0U61_12920 [Nocardioidaceae bacterium]|nr:hypothetical protein [Nocardioidaceae bacterium]